MSDRRSSTHRCADEMPKPSCQGGHDPICANLMSGGVCQHLSRLRFVPTQRQYHDQRRCEVFGRPAHCILLPYHTPMEAHGRRLWVRHLIVVGELDTAAFTGLSSRSKSAMSRSLVGSNNRLADARKRQMAENRRPWPAAVASFSLVAAWNSSAILRTEARTFGLTRGGKSATKSVKPSPSDQVRR